MLRTRESIQPFDRPIRIAGPHFDVMLWRLWKMRTSEYKHKPKHDWANQIPVPFEALKHEQP